MNSYAALVFCSMHNYSHPYLQHKYHRETSVLQCQQKQRATDRKTDRQTDGRQTKGYLLLCWRNSKAERIGYNDYLSIEDQFFLAMWCLQYMYKDMRYDKLCKVYVENIFQFVMFVMLIFIGYNANNLGIKLIAFVPWYQWWHHLLSNATQRPNEYVF